MPFDQSTILSGPNCEPDGVDTLVWWISSSPDDGSVLFQLYANRRLAWHGPARQVVLPSPAEATLYQVGTVGPGEGDEDFSSSLPLLMGTGNRASLDWLGGYWEAPDLQGFYVYGSDAPGGSVDYATILDTIAVSAPNVPVGGYGQGGYGQGGYGAASGHYWWTSGPLANGVWTFAVKAFDAAGNLSTPMTFAVTIAGPPGPPARDPTTGLRLTYTYNASTHVVTLNWNASPG